VLDDPHDVQDAFQATFVVFLRRAPSIRNRESLASWLFGVALKVARRARHSAIVRRFHERKSAEFVQSRSATHDRSSVWLPALHEEISRLPERYREPIVLCYLQGLSTASVARQLGCPQGTILSRLARGRERLRERLTQRGPVELTGLLMAARLPREASAILPSTLLSSTVKAAGPALAGRTILTAILAPSIVSLTHTTQRIVFMIRIPLVAALLTTITVVTALNVPAVSPAPDGPAQAAATDKAAQPKPRRGRPALIRARDLEDALYEILKRNHEFDNPRWPFVIKIRDVQERTLIGATFKKRAAGKDGEIDQMIQAESALLGCDMEARILHAFLEGVEVEYFTQSGGKIVVGDLDLNIPIPPGDPLGDLQSGALHARRASTTSGVPLSLQMSPDGKTLATAGFDGVVHLWDITKGEQVAGLKGEKATVRSVAFSPDGRTVASVNDTGIVRIWDLKTRKSRQTLPGLSEPMRRATGTFMLDSIAFSPDGRLLAFSGFGPTSAEPASRAYELSVFDLSVGKTRWSHMGQGEQACSLAFSPDGSILARAGWKDVKLWDAETGEPVRTLIPDKGTIFAIAFTANGHALIGGGNITTSDENHQAGLVTVWNVATGRITHSLGGHTGGVHAVAVSPDGKLAASGGDGDNRPPTSGTPSEVRLWDVATGKLVWTLRGEQGVVRGLAFAPDGSTLVYCDERTIAVVDVATGRILRILLRF
jgi:RNA polymerase sigma factor (sigma-70 family)